MRSRILPIAALAAATALALTGCATSAPTGNGAPGGGQNNASLFEFQTPRYGSDSGELTIRIPDGLVDALGSGTGDLLVVSARVTPRELDSSKFCAFDVAIEYADGGAKVLAAPSPTEEEAKAKAAIEMQNLLTGFDVMSVEELTAGVERIVSDSGRDGLTTL